MANACGSRRIAEELFKPAASGMSLVLRAGATTRLKFQAIVEGESVLLDLFFNETFRRSSWTRPMRPDASLVVRTHLGDEVWLHFDAKYRVDWTFPFQTGGVDEEEESERDIGTSKRADLLKMHAYRDAIRDSAGSYVLFPGSDTIQFTFARDEFLPGLGAFPMRPERSEEDTDRLSDLWLAQSGMSPQLEPATGVRHIGRRAPMTERAHRIRRPYRQLANFPPRIRPCSWATLDLAINGDGFVVKACTTYEAAVAQGR